MALRDHYRPPIETRVSWSAIHATWPVQMILQIIEILPEGYIAEPASHYGKRFEVDIATYEQQNWLADGEDFAFDRSGATATALQTVVEPTISVETDLDDQAEYTVRIYDQHQARKLVAVVEIVSPANKDRPENRSAFTTKCAAFLQSGVSVTIVDIVTTRHFNMYSELSAALRLPPPVVAGRPESLYAVVCRGVRRPQRKLRFEAWVEELAIGKPLPTLPIWLTEDLWVPLDLEASYEKTCRVFRLPSIY